MDKPNALIIVALAGIINQQYQDIIDFLNAEIKIIKELYGKDRFTLNNTQRRRLAAIFNKLDKQLVSQQELIVTPKTMTLWYKKLIAQKWDHSDKAKKKPGRPKLNQDDIDMTLKLINENPSWGDDSISNRLKNIGISVSKSSVGRIREKYGHPPAPERVKTGEWDKFLKANWETLVAIDFKTVEVLSGCSELETFYVLFAIHLSTREVRLCGITRFPKEPWVIQMARNLTDPFDGFFFGKTHCIMDNDSIFSPAFKKRLKGSGTKPVVTVVRKPNMNAYIERYIGSYKAEVLNWLIPQSEKHLREITREWLKYYNTERNHQGIEERIIKPSDGIGKSEGSVEMRSRLGGLLHYYHRKAS